MAIRLLPLPYEKNALEPYLSAETLEYHYSKHHANYVSTLNRLIKDTSMQNKTLEQIISQSQGSIFNNAAQVWNHNFYWQSLTPSGEVEPFGSLSRAIDQKWGSFGDFTAAFTDKAINNFGSGWTWLVLTQEKTLDIINTANGNTPITRDGIVPLLSLDLWEHAYYIDYRDARAKYVACFWSLANWTFASKNFEKNKDSDLNPG